MNTLSKLKAAKCQIFSARQASFCQLTLISDTHITFENPGIGSMLTKDQKL